MRRAYLERESARPFSMWIKCVVDLLWYSFDRFVMRGNLLPLHNMNRFDGRTIDRNFFKLVKVRID